MATRSYIPCPQWRVVNLLQERGVGGDVVRDANWFGGTDEFHKEPFYLGLTAPNPRGTRSHPHEALSTVTSLRSTLGPGGSGDRVRRCLSEG